MRFSIQSFKFKLFLLTTIVALCIAFVMPSAHAAAAHGHIRSALVTIDKIKALSDANPADQELQILRDLFFSGDTPKEDMVRAFARGSVTPDTLGLIGAVFHEGSYPHYGDTGLFYTLLAALAGKADANGDVEDEDIAFALGCITHYVADKYTHPIVNEFAGSTFGKAADHTVVKFDLNTGNIVYNGSGLLETYDPNSSENKKRHTFFEFWLVKDMLVRDDITSMNTTSELADDLKYYLFNEEASRISDSQIGAVKDTFRQLWGSWNTWGVNPLTIKDFDYVMMLITTYISSAHSTNVQVDSSYIVPIFAGWSPLPAIVLPTEEDSENFQIELLSLGTVEGVNYSSLNVRFNDCLDNKAPDESIEIFRRATPFMEDKLLSKMTIKDLKLQNNNLDTGRLTTAQENTDHHTPEIYEKINPERIRSYITNRGDGTLRGVELSGERVLLGPSIPLEGLPRAVAFDPTGRYAWVANTGSDTISWIDAFEDKELDQNIADGASITRLEVGSFPNALAVTPDGSRLYVANRDSCTVSAIDLAKRELIATIPIIINPIADESVHDIKIRPEGDYAYVSVQHYGGIPGWHPGSLTVIDVRPEILSAGELVSNPNYNKVIKDISLPDIYQRGESQKPRGIAMAPSGEELYVINKGRNWKRGGPFDPVYLPVASAGAPVNPHVQLPENFPYRPWRVQIVDTKIYICPVLLAPAIVSILCVQTTPPGIYTYIHGVDQIVPLITVAAAYTPFGFGLWTMRLTLWVSYEIDPLWTFKGFDADVPPVRYSNYPVLEYHRQFREKELGAPLAYAAFSYTGNLGIFDRDKKEFFAATYNRVFEGYHGGQTHMYFNMAASSIGDIIVTDPLADQADFFPGKELFKVLSNTPRKTLGYKPIDRKISWREVSRHIVSPRPIGGLSHPWGVDIQPIVYFPRPLTGETLTGDITEQGAELDFMIFSHKKIKDINVFCGPFRNIPLKADGNQVQWAQKHDRFWELIIRTTTEGPLAWPHELNSGPKHLKFEVTLDNGAIVTLFDSPAIQNIEPSPSPPEVDLDLEVVVESEEETVGGFVCVNDDDDNNNGTPDRDEPGSVDEDDLVNIVLWPVQPSDVYTGNVTLRVTEGGPKIKVWESSTKGIEVALPKIYSTPLDLEGGRALWVEGISVSDPSGRDVELVLEYTKDGKTYEDKVRFTVIKVDLDIDGVLDSEEENVGGFACVNDDDDNNNGTPDRDEPGSVDFEDDLVMITLWPVQPSDVYAGNVTLRVTEGGPKIEVWEDPNRDTRSPMTYSNPLDLEGGKELWVEGISVSDPSGRDVELVLEYTRGEETYDDKVRFSVVNVEISRASTEDAAGNKYGYDEMDDPPSANDDHVSVEKNDSTFVRVKVLGTTDSSAFTFISTDTGIADVGPLPIPAPAAGFLLGILGQNQDKDEARIEARVGGPTGPLCGFITVNVYKEIAFNGKYFRIFKTGDEAGTLPPAVPQGDIETAANKFIKYSVATLTLAAPTRKGVAFDLNDNGRVDFYKNAPDTETKKIYDAVAADGAGSGDLVLLKDSFYRTWVISASVSAGDTTISLPGVNGLLVGTREYRISKANKTDSETFKIVSIAGTTITIDTDPGTAGNQGFTNAHPKTADPRTTHVVVDNQFQTVGLGADPTTNQPALVVGATAASIGRILGHEQMHGTGLSDVNDLTNLMHWTIPTPTTLPLRFKELVQVVTGTPNPKPGSPTDNQWEKPAR